MAFYAVLLSCILVFCFPVAVFVFRSRARAFLLLHLAVVCLTPYWLGVSIGANFLPIALLSTILMLALSAFSATPVFLDRLDVLFGLVFVSTLAALLVSDASWAQWFGLLLAWLLPFILGRKLAGLISVQQLSRLFVPVGVFLGVWAILELSLDWHPFAHLTDFGGPADIWASIQYRGGYPRSEGAFGTSIVLGNVLALTVPFILAARIRVLWRVIVMMIVVGGIAATFSRNALVAAAVSAVLSSVQLRKGPGLAKRLTTALLTGSVVLMLVGVYVSVTADFATDEVANSTEYRQGYLSLLNTLHAFGPASSLVEYAPGRWGYASADYAGGIAKSIDSSVMLVALQFGWVPAVMMVVVLTVIVLSAMTRRGRGNPALIAAAALVPSILTVAMVTQLPYIYWLILGMGVAAKHDEDRPTAIRYNQLGQLRQFP